MKYIGTILRTQRSRSGITLIVETPVGLRGVELDRILWAQILADFSQPADATLSGWTVEYDPEHGDLEIIAPPGSEPDGYDARSEPEEQSGHREGDR